MPIIVTTHNVLEELFRGQEQLLEEPAVKKLIEYAQAQHKSQLAIYKGMKDFHDEVLEVFMYSDTVLIQGRSAQDSMKLIGNLLEKH